MKLSNQAMGAVMLALQKALLEQSDIVPVLQQFNFQLGENEELIVLNPPTFSIDNEESSFEEKNHTVGSD